MHAHACTHTQTLTHSIKHIHAVIWCMQPEEAQTRALEEEAAAIKTLLQECKSASVGKNIIFLVKEPRDPLGKDSRDVQVRNAPID